MAREWLFPGVGYVAEDGEEEYLIPGGGYFSEDQPEATATGADSMTTLGVS